MKIFTLITATLLLAAPAAQAQTANPFETREDAWRRQQSERYQFEQRNPNSLNPPAGRLGDPPVRPSPPEQRQWDPGPSSAPSSHAPRHGRP